MSVDYALEPFDRRSLPPAEVVAKLHAELLPSSPVVKLGVDFLERFCYTTLISDGAIFGSVAYVGKDPAGFISATDDAVHFMSAAFRRRFLSTARIVGFSVLKRPVRLAAIWENLRLMSTRESDTSHELQGEILSMGVLAAYRDASFVGRTGLRIAPDLLEQTVTRLQSIGRHRISAMVAADDLAAQLFYRGMGWRLERTSVPGWRVPNVEFVKSL